jgi:hypothetical protein
VSPQGAVDLRDLSAGPDFITGVSLLVDGGGALDIGH